jgi:acetyl esterase
MLDQETITLLDRLQVINEEMLADQRFTGMEMARAYSAAVFAAFAGPIDDAAVECTSIEVEGAAGKRPARGYRPAQAGDERLPGVVFFHGGGWSVGDLDCYDELVRALTALSGVQFVSVDYRLAPENPFPAGLEDAISATRWIAKHGAELGIDPDRLGVMGDSAGGNLAAGVTNHSVLEPGFPPITAQYLIYPVIDVSRPHEAYPSRMAFGGGEYMLTRDAIDATRDWYLGPEDRADDPRISPIHAGDLGRLPPTYVMVAGHDPLRDEGQAYYERLKAAGVEVHFDCVEQTVHAFLSFGVLENARQARQRLAGFVSRSLKLKAGELTP